jgi:uncharacterized protein (TIGR02646 family)
MRTITRNPAPACLGRQPKAQAWVDFMGTQCHIEVANSLLVEQCYLCCYCELEINVANSHIEHMEPRSAGPGRAYDYSNLASSCNGGHVEHCGHYKDDQHRNPGHAWDPSRFCAPHDPGTVRRIAYLIDGSVRAAHGDHAAEYVVGYLGLDCARLRERRMAHARAVVDTLGPTPQPDMVAWATGYYLQPDAGRLRQFHSLSRTVLQA